MIDNFDLIKSLLTFDSEDEFYFVQILQRKKDNPNGRYGSNNSSRLVKAYYIKSIEHLEMRKDEMILFATHFNARVGINLNKRSYEKTAFNALKKVAEVMHNKNYKMVHRAWNTACGIHNGGDKIWLLDIDTKNAEYIHKVQSFVKEQQPCGDKVFAIIPSKSGVHIMTKGFDLRDFSQAYSEIEVHKNNPTNLYIP
jgi:hypothetical protein